MASGRPILAVVPSESEVAQLVRAGDCGVCVAPGQPESLASTILELKADPERLVSLGNNGRALLESRFSRRQSVRRYEELLRHTQA